MGGGPSARAPGLNLLAEKTGEEKESAAGAFPPQRPGRTQGLRAPISHTDPAVPASSPRARPGPPKLECEAHRLPFHLGGGGQGCPRAQIIARSPATRVPGPNPQNSLATPGPDPGQKDRGLAQGGFGPGGPHAAVARVWHRGLVRARRLRGGPGKDRACTPETDSRRWEASENVGPARWDPRGYCRARVLEKEPSRPPLHPNSSGPVRRARVTALPGSGSRAGGAAGREAGAGRSRGGSGSGPAARHPGARAGFSGVSVAL